MHLLARIIPATLLILAADGPAEKPPKPVAATVESTLATESNQIRQFALDGDDATYFVSKTNPGDKDSFTLTFAAPVTVQSVAVRTGKPDGSDRLEGGTLEGSRFGTTFQELATFKDGEAKAEPRGPLKVIRIRPAAGEKHPLVIREIAIDSEPQVAVFKYPVEFTVDISDAPEMRDWAEKAARTCEDWYGRINEELRSDGYRPIHRVRMTLKRGIGPPAFASNGQITGKVEWFKEHPGDVGAMIHETCHIVQRYRSRTNPGWLVEGVADYIRFFKYEPGKVGPINAQRAHYDGNYRVTARFLDYATEKYDKQLVLKLNKAMREGTYKDQLFTDLTGKTLAELDEEWRATLKK
ncbi:MAG TPA: basic secretory protein-like protein [Isosphaeraceae bacterium]